MTFVQKCDVGYIPEVTNNADIPPRLHIDLAGLNANLKICIPDAYGNVGISMNFADAIGKLSYC